MKNLVTEWKFTVLVLVIILFAALGARLQNLTVLPVFADEAIYIRWSQIMSAEPTLRFLPLSDGKQPLFMWVLMFFVNRFSDPLFAGRALSVVSGTGSIIGLFLLTYYLFKSKAAALAAAVLWAFSPLTFFFERMALVDALLTTFGIWTLFLGIVVARTLRLDAAILAGFALGGAALTKSTALFYAALLFTLPVLVKKPKTIFKLGGLFLVTFIIAGLMYNIQRLGPNFNLLSERTKDYVFPLSRILVYPTDPIRYNLPSAAGWLVDMGPLGLLLLGITGVLLNVKKYPKYILILAIWFFAPLLFISEFTKSFTTRYILFLTPPLYVLAASAFNYINGKWKYLVGFGFVLFAVQAAVFDYRLLTNPVKAAIPKRERMGYFQEWTSGVGIKQVADYIKEIHSRNPDRKIVVGTEGYFGTLPDGLAMYIAHLPNVIVVGTGLGHKEIPEALLNSAKSGNLTYFVGNDDRLTVSPDKLNQKIVMTFPKEARYVGTMEYDKNGPRETLYFLEITKESGNAK